MGFAARLLGDRLPRKLRFGFAKRGRATAKKGVRLHLVLPLVAHETCAHSARMSQLKTLTRQGLEPITSCRSRTVFPLPLVAKLDSK